MRGRCLAAGLTAMCLAIPAPGSAQTVNPDGTVTCESRRGYRVEVGAKRHCGLGYRVLHGVRSYFREEGVAEGDRFRVRGNKLGARRYTLRCEVVAVGRFGSQTLCSRGRLQVNLSRTAG